MTNGLKRVAGVESVETNKNDSRWKTRCQSEFSNGRKLAPTIAVSNVIL